MSEPVQVEQAVQQWEYKKTQGENEELLNKLGEQGWEVIAPIAGYQGSTEGLLLKRPKKTPDYGYSRSAPPVKRVVWTSL